MGECKFPVETGVALREEYSKNELIQCLVCARLYQQQCKFLSSHSKQMARSNFVGIDTLQSGHTTEAV